METASAKSASKNADQNAAQLHRWRADTPAANDVTHLNNAGSSLMPTVVVHAMRQQLDREVALGGYEAQAESANAIAATYGSLASLLGTQPHNIAIAPSASQAFLNAFSAFDWTAGDILLTSSLDYTSQQILYLSMIERRGVHVITAPDLPEGGVDPQSVSDILRNKRPKLVSMSWIPTHAGTIQDLPAVGQACRAAGVPFLVDACQAVGQLPVNVEHLGCDYLSGTARKFLRGPRGIGFLYVSDAALSRGEAPLHVDMHGATWTAPDRYTLANDARRFEEWEHSYINVLGLGAAAQYAVELDFNAACTRAHTHAANLRAWAGTVPGLRALDRGHHLSAIVTLEVAGHDARNLVAALRAQHIHTGATLQWVGLRDLGPRGVQSAIRVSPHYFNTSDEIEQFKNALVELTR
jgi:selenocysteine lyase/cysteine desulfurase